MCLALYKPAKTKPDKEAYRNGFENNDHGAGFAAIAEGGLIIAKGFFKFKKFWKAFAPYADCPAIVHFRLATHGKHDEDNCHPFAIADNLAMIHNGILNICTKDDKTKSDTWHYVEKILKPLHAKQPEFYSDPEIRFLGESAIAGSKFIFLRSDGDVCIWNEDAGSWAEDGHWYSNDSYKARSIFSSRSTSSLSSSRSSLAWDDDDVARYVSGLPSNRMDADFGSRGSRWSPFVPDEMEHIADELISFGYSVSDIEAGFREDPNMMEELYEDCLDVEANFLIDPAVSMNGEL